MSCEMDYTADVYMTSSECLITLYDPVKKTQVQNNAK